MDRARLRQIIKEELSRAVNEGGLVSGVGPLIDEFIELNDGIIGLSLAYRGPMLSGDEDIVENIASDFKHMMGRRGYRVSESEATSAGMKIARMIASHRHGMSKRHSEEDIEDPYGPEY